MSSVKIFENKEFGEIRTVMVDGVPWFVGKDVAGALGYADSTGAVRKRTDEEDRGVAKMDTPSGAQELVIINESGLYSLILGSKLPSAKQFKRWVTSEVLPSIRQIGTYAIKREIMPTEHPGEVANLIKVLWGIQKQQGSAPYKGAENAKLVCEQYGIAVIPDFIKIPEYEQMELPLYVDQTKRVEEQRGDGWNE